MIALKYYPCNFVIKDSPTGKRALVRCPDCQKENYGLNVLVGYCTWCGFNINESHYLTNDLTKDDNAIS